MQMDGWVDYLHVSWIGEHVLFPSLSLHSFPHFVVASLFTISLCLLERTLTFAIAKKWCPINTIRYSRVGRAVWSASFYWMVTLLRLLYMLVAMTFNTGIIIVTVTALAAGQFVIEYLEEPFPGPPPSSRLRQQDPENIKEPLLRSDDSYEPSVPLHVHPQYDSPKSDGEFNTFYRPYSRSPSPPLESPRGADPFSMSHPASVPSSRPGTASSASSSRLRLKSKPTEIFIHPSESNLARADAAALQLGLSGDTELVKGNHYPVNGNAAWDMGKGKDLAREMMRKSTV